MGASVLYTGFLVIFMVLLFYLSSAGSVMLDFCLIRCENFDIFSPFLVDGVSIICLLMLFICGLTVMPFVFHYMGSFFLGWNLYFLMLFFITVMGILIVSGDFLFTLMAWEYLGLVSYLLILFLGNATSVRASLITLFASRVGDVPLFLLVGLGGFVLGVDSGLFTVLILLVILTKSACFPFCSWLLEAMRAPTPVSCLVHSSTLVAAGVWFSLRYSSFFSDTGLFLLCLLSLYTILLTAFSALFLVDLKKLVALSTCNNISWCLLCFSLGDLKTCLLFLMTHGVSKCLLFICMGDLMSSSGASQSGVGVYFCRYTGKFNPVVYMILLSSLCGLPYLGVFAAKHLLLSDAGMTFSPFLYFLSCFCVSLSFAYTYRFSFLLLNGVGGLSLGILREFYVYFFVGVLPSLMGFLGYYLFLSSGVVYDFLSVVSLFFLMHLVGLLMGAFFYFNLFSFFNGGVWAQSLWGSDCFVGYFYFLGFVVSYSFYSCCYRWEIFILRRCNSFFNKISSSLSLFGGVNYVVLGLIWCFSLGYFF